MRDPFFRLSILTCSPGYSLGWVGRDGLEGLLGVLREGQVVPHQGGLLEPCLDAEGLEEVRADHDVLGIDSLAMEVDELLGEVLGLVLDVLEVVLREGQHGVL